MSDPQPDWLADWLASAATLLVLAPHPDDDVLGCARLMQRAQVAGCGIVVAWLTEGGLSHGALSHASRAALAARRHDEALTGVRALGVTLLEACFLDYPDGELDFAREEAGQRLESLCRRHDVRLLAVTDRDDGHPDHRAAFAIGAALPIDRVLSYPISTRFDGNYYAPPPDALLLHAGPDDRKREALLAHRSQMEADAVVPMTLHTIERFCDEPEIFLPVRGGGRAG